MSRRQQAPLDSIFSTGGALLKTESVLVGYALFKARRLRGSWTRSFCDSIRRKVAPQDKRPHSGTPIWSLCPLLLQYYQRLCPSPSASTFSCPFDPMVFSISYILGYVAGSALHSAFRPFNLVALGYCVSRQYVSGAHLLPLLFIISVLCLFASISTVNVNICGAFARSSLRALFPASLCGRPPTVNLSSTKRRVPAGRDTSINMRKCPSTGLGEFLAIFSRQHWLTLFGA